MATIYVGSARHDEYGKYVNGSQGDQLQKSSSNDTVGEVSMQPMYKHSKGWYIIRAVSEENARLLALAMILACNNANLGYDQNGRLGVVNNGIDSKVKTECDCSSLIRAIIKYVTGKDVGNFTTANALAILINSGMFKNVGKYVSQASTPVYDGDILVTCSKGHIVIVCSGNPRGKAIATTYSQAQFIADVESILQVSTVSAAFNKTVEISKTKNKHHALVTPLERYMKAIGYYSGTVEADEGKTPSFGNGMHNAVINYQKNVVKSTGKNVDGILSAKGLTWKKLLGLS